MSDSRGFLKYPRVEQKKRAMSERIQDWRDVSLPLTTEQITQHFHEQSARCMDCGVPFCQSTQGCPVENLIPDWNDLVHQGRWKEALESLHSTNNFPEITGKLCPAPCESACVLGSPGVQNDPVSIRSIESGIVERGFQEGWVLPLLPSKKTGKKVAVIGSGPAGLAAAQQLARAGHTVTVFEKSKEIGGLLRYGIPDFKLEKTLLNRRLEQMQAEGVIFKSNIEVGDEDTRKKITQQTMSTSHGFIDIEEIQQTFDAICLTIGAEQPRDIRVPGRELAGIYFAMEYLTQQNSRVEGKLSENEGIHARNKHVVILGGGDTGSDCLGTAHRQGCKQVHQFEIMPMPPEIPAHTRHHSTPWPLWPFMLRSSHAHEEGGQRRWSVATTEFMGDNGNVTHLKGIEVYRDAQGQLQPVLGSEFKLQADLVLLAMGFTGVPRESWLEKLGVTFNSQGNIESGSHHSTRAPGVFVAGDAKRGASLIVWAIAEGRKMAQSVHEYLMG